MPEIAFRDQAHDDGGWVYLRQLTLEDVTNTYLPWFRDSVVTEYCETRNLNRKDVVDYMVSGRIVGVHVMFGINALVRDHLPQEAVA